MNCDVQSKFLTITEIEDGFPHSDILGSKLVRSSPRLIAAYHVLHRLLAPRHPPDTLNSLDHSHYQYPLTHKLVQKVLQLFGLMLDQYPFTHKAPKRLATFCAHAGSLSITLKQVSPNGKNIPTL